MEKENTHKHKHKHIIKKDSKRDTLLLIFSILGIIAIFVLLLNMENIFPTPTIDTANLENKIQQGILTNTENVNKDVILEPGKNIEMTTLSNYQKCVAEQGIDPEAVIFFHSNSCPHCIEMKPKVVNVQAQGHKIYWAESSDPQASNVMVCFKDIMSGYVPFFVCPATGETHTGGMTEPGLAKFSEQCK